MGEIASAVISGICGVATTGISVVGANKRAKVNADAQEKIAALDAKLQKDLAELEEKSNSKQGSGISTNTVIIVIIIAIIGGLIYFKTKK